MSQLLAVLDDLLATDPHDLVDRQLADALIEFEQIARRLDAARARTLAVFDSRRACAADGYPTTTSWLRAQCGSSRGAASSAVRLARGLRDLPLTASALGDGRISAAHAAAITGLLPAIPLQRLLETEAQFVTLAEQWEPGQLHRYAQTVRHAYDPEATVAEEARKHDLRHLGLASTLDGVVYLRGNGPAEAGAVIDTALTALAAKTAGDLRSRGQRYFDALETLCRAYLDAGQLPTSGGARPHITVLVDLTTLQGHPGSKMADLGYAGQISGEAARRLCCDADITRILTDGPSVLLDVGREQRTVTPTMRRALAARDKGCVFPRCGAAPGQCQAHHLIHWARGGTTSLDTMGLICPYHHRAVHEGRWTLHHNPDGSWTANPP